MVTWQRRKDTGESQRGRKRSDNWFLFTISTTKFCKFRESRATPVCPFKLNKISTKALWYKTFDSRPHTHSSLKTLREWWLGSSTAALPDQLSALVHHHKPLWHSSNDWVHAASFLLLHLTNFWSQKIKTGLAKPEPFKSHTHTLKDITLITAAWSGGLSIFLIERKN